MSIVPDEVRAMDKVKLKPCPWCPSGGSISSGEASSQYPDGRTSVQTGCTECGAMGPERNTEEEADAAWNTRALEAENAALKASAPSEDEVSALERVELLMCKQLRMLGEITELNAIERAGVMSTVEAERADLRALRNLLSRQGNLERAKR